MNLHLAQFFFFFFFFARLSGRKSLYLVNTGAERNSIIHFVVTFCRDKLNINHHLCVSLLASGYLNISVVFLK